MLRWLKLAQSALCHFGSLLSSFGPSCHLFTRTRWANCWTYCAKFANIEEQPSAKDCQSVAPLNSRRVASGTDLRPI